MKIPEFLRYKDDGKIITLNVHEMIRKYATCENGCGLSEWFQVLYDTPKRAVWRVNKMIHVNGDWLGQIVCVDLDKKTIGFGNDCGMQGLGYSHHYYDMKPNCIIENTYELV